MPWGLSHNEEVTDLAKETPFASRASHMLRKIRAVHRATDSALRKKSYLRCSEVTENSVIQVTEPTGDVLFCLSSKKEG
jgi:hypothetical protein